MPRKFTVVLSPNEIALIREALDSHIYWQLSDEKYRDNGPENPMPAKKPEVTYRIEVEQDDIPVRGNAMCSGDDSADKEVEDEILRRLDAGDVWAWASVCVVASYEGFEGRDYLVGCSYKDENEFRQPGGYFDDMKARALEDLRGAIQRAVDKGERAKRALRALCASLPKG